MGKKSKTIYITDLDGTLLNSDGRTSQFTNNVINGLIDRGGLFSFATARSEETATPVVNGFNISAPPIFYNGAVIGYSHSALPPTRIYFDDNIVDLITELIDNDIFPTVYSYIENEEKFSFIQDKCTHDMTEFLDTRKHCKRARPIKTFEELIKGNVFYLLCIDSENKLSPFYEKYRNKYYCVFQKDSYTDGLWLEIMPKTSTKANAAVTLKERLSCDELVVFGDNKNDIELFKVADRCYAVANAVSELKAIATDVIESNNDDGVARFILKDLKNTEKRFK